MKKEDEFDYWRAIRHAEAHDLDRTFRQIARDLEIPSERAWYLLEKWERKGYTDCGVSPMAGWLTEFGRETVLTRYKNIEPDDQPRYRWPAY